MPIAHRWHRGSEFGAGPRAPLDRERRAQWRTRLDLFRRTGRLTALHVEIGRALLRRLAEDGRCDPAHDTLADDAGCSSRTVRRALVALAECGLVRWSRRLVRDGWRTAQTSNGYALEVGNAQPCGGQNGRGTILGRFFSLGWRTKAASMLGKDGGPSSGDDEWARWNARRQLAVLAASM